MKWVNSVKRIYTLIAVMGVSAVALLLATLLTHPFGDQSVYLNGYVQLFVNNPANGVSETMRYFWFGACVLACIVIPYLLGSCNFAILISRVRNHDDIRRYGSGNAGMTNMIRTFGMKEGLVTLLGDVLKMAVCIFLGRLLYGENNAYLAALFCTLGHIAPAFFRFRGGKGVASSAMAILLLDPVVFLVVLTVFLLVLLISRYVSLASMIAAFAYPGAVVAIAQVRGMSAPPAIAMLFAVFIGLLIIFKHRDNIKRIYDRTESKFSFHKKSAVQTPKETYGESPEESGKSGKKKKK